MSGKYNSEGDETTKVFTKPSTGRESQGVQVQDPNIVFHNDYPPDSSEKSRHSTVSSIDLNDPVIGTKGNGKFTRNSVVVPGGMEMAPRAIDGQPAGSNEGNNISPWFGTDEKHIFLKSTPFTFNVPAFQHGPIRLVKSDLINAIHTPEPKPFDSPSDSLDWVALQWATTEGVQGLFSDPTDLSENAREQLGDRLCDWLGDLGYSSNSLGALVSEGDVVRNYKQHADEKPPSPVQDWTDVYRTLSGRQQQGWYHDAFEVQESDGLSEVMSLMSYAESIFDAATTMSTASSAPGDTQELIGKFANLLVRDTSVSRMLSMALSDTGMGQERFRRNFSRILRSYSRELRRSLETGRPEDSDPSYGQAAAFVSRKAPHASQLIVSRFSQARTSVPPRNTLPESDGESSSESEEGEGENEVLNMEKLESFFITGEPFRLLRWKLRALIFPDSFLTRVRSSTEQLVRIASRCGLTGLLSRAQQQKGQSFGNFWADFADQIEYLARNLKVQCSTLGQIRVADFLMAYSRYVAARLEESLATAQGPGSQENSLSDGILQDIVANMLPEVWEVDFPVHWGFIASAKAFQDFFSDVRDLAYPTIFSRAEKLISKWNEPEGQRLLPVLSELRWAIQRTQGGRTSKSPFSINPQVSSITDRLKLAVEASTGAQWEWWPFCSPLRHQAYNLPGDEVLSWTCPCGILRRQRISPRYAQMLRDLAETLPLSLPVNTNMPPIPTSSFSTHSHQDSAASVTDDSSLDWRSSSDSLSSGSTPVTASSGTGGSVAISIDDHEVEQFVFILVLDSRYHLITTDVSKMASQDFFQALKAGYNTHRGILRRIFSIFVYSHCDFIQVKRWAPNRFAPGNTFSFPPCDNDEYIYSPQPMLEPPITPHQFYELFYSCYDSECLGHRLHSVLSAVVPIASTCDVLDNISDEFLLCLPKRDTSVNAAAQFARGDKFEVFWGLVARERRSTARVIMYTLASLVPSLVFAFEWMFDWNHLGDLQNASVPFTATCAIWGLLWAVVYSGSDIQNG